MQPPGDAMALPVRDFQACYERSQREDVGVSFDLSLPKLVIWSGVKRPFIYIQFHVTYSSTILGVKMSVFSFSLIFEF